MSTREQSIVFYVYNELLTGTEVYSLNDVLATRPIILRAVYGVERKPYIWRVYPKPGVLHEH
jgi:hypothetical protein